MAEQILGLIQMYATPSVKDDGAIDLIYDIHFMDPVTKRHFRKFPETRKHRA
jgi:hypothetical protein